MNSLPITVPTAPSTLNPSNPHHPPDLSHWDLAGYCGDRPTYLQTRARINYLVDHYLSLDTLSHRLTDLPSQFATPHQRPWQRIEWRQIHPDQIVGIDPTLFTQVVASAVEIEAPIKGYANESWHYLQQSHPQAARFMGGVWNAEGQRLEVGIWEKEERQHAPAFGKIYQTLTGTKLKPVPNSVQGYCSTGNPRADLYRHIVGRIATEWAATSTYLWLMAHSTGALQMAIAQPLQDEVNHLAKFWGMTYWGFQDFIPLRILRNTQALIHLTRHHQGERSNGQDLLRLRHAKYMVELGFTFTRVMSQLCRWHGHLRQDALAELFGPQPVTH
ncbi:MAG: hypothetical protein VKJ64_19750 [Leptolyngbyaceae bacterium]|nr:hypothetical protein [Leptolyngbyaceae bacterium]